MKILALDTTTTSGSVALLDNARPVGEISSEAELSHSERLLASVDFLLKQNGLRVEDLDGFAVAAGPGSFTGIRIGLSTVKAFAYASGKPVAAVSTLEALSWKLREGAARLVAPVVDAKKGEIYSALFETGKRGLREIIPQGAYPPDGFLSLLPSRRIIHFLGSGVRVYGDKIAAYLRDKARFSARSTFIAAEVGMIGYEKLMKHQAVDFKALEPIYFRKSQAEEKK
jgi:tRNA threonylcarbamoyladenosine biosynthesis protein TsaB